MEQLETSDTGTTKTIIAYHVSKKLDALSLRYIRLHVRVIPLAFLSKQPQVATLSWGYSSRNAVTVWHHLFWIYWCLLPLPLSLSSSRRHGYASSPAPKERRNSSMRFWRDSISVKSDCLGTICNLSFVSDGKGNWSDPTGYSFSHLYMQGGLKEYFFVIAYLLIPLL